MPSLPATAWPTGRVRPGTRPRPATSSPRCCRSASGSWAPSTLTPPDPPAPTSPARRVRRATRPRPVISSPPCCPPTSESTAPSTRTPWTPATTSRAGPGPGEAGDAATACDQLAGLLLVNERIHGAGHPRTLPRPVSSTPALKVSSPATRPSTRSRRPAAERHVRRLDPDQAGRRVHVEAEQCLGQRPGGGGRPGLRAARRRVGHRPRSLAGEQLGESPVERGGGRQQPVGQPGRGVADARCGTVP